MTDIDDTILDKIRKVQGYLKSDNPNEAAVAAAKLTEMLVKYNLTLSDIPESERKADPFSLSHTDKEYRLTEWRITLASAVARANLCRIVIENRGSQKADYLSWVGRQSNIEVAQYIYETCAADLQRICDTLWYAIFDLTKDLPPENRIHGKTWKLQFMEGAAIGVQTKLREETAAWQSSDTNVNALITTNANELQAYMNQMFGRLGSHSGGMSSGGNAFGLGVKTGKNISFKTGVGTGGSSGPRQIGSGK